MLATFFTIWVLHLAAAVTPGPNILLVSHLAASTSRRTALYAASGIAFASVIWASGAALGVSALFAAFPRFRLALQLIGAGYLLYLAIRMWRSPQQQSSVVRTFNASRAFRVGTLTTLSNPKAALFYGGIFSTALPAHPTPGVVVAVVAMILVNALCWYCLLAYLFSHASVQASYDRKRRLFARASSAILGGLGAWLLAMSLREVVRD
jgi:threonine efflux protein